jgi:hypothetical protein
VVAKLSTTIAATMPGMMASIATASAAARVTASLIYVVATFYGGSLVTCEVYY